MTAYIKSHSFDYTHPNTVFCMHIGVYALAHTWFKTLLREGKRACLNSNNRHFRSMSVDYRPSLLQSEHTPPRLTPIQPILLQDSLLKPKAKASQQAVQPHIQTLISSRKQTCSISGTFRLHVKLN